MLTPITFPTPSPIPSEGTNRSPVASGDAATVKVNNSVDINVLDDDSDPDGDPLKLSIFKPPSLGKAVVNDNGTPDNFNDDFITYTPAAHVSGDGIFQYQYDIFQYQIEDGRGGSDVTKVEVTIDTNRSPVASGDSATVNANSSVDIYVLDDDSDPDGDPLKLSIFQPPSKGKVVINHNGTPDNPKDDFFTYTPDANVSGDEIFQYQIDDGRGGSDVTKVEVTIDTNQSPVASGDAATVNANSSVDIHVLDDDTDPDGDPLKLSIFKPAFNGKAAVNDNGTPDNLKDDFITYTPNANFSGDDIFHYQIEDGRGGSDVTKVEVTVKAIIPSILNGTPDADTLAGTQSNDIINGNGGDDFIDGQGGNDSINGGLGNFDRIFGGAGDDSITDPDGVQEVYGGTGNDTINITFAAPSDNNTNPNYIPPTDGKIIGGIGNDSITVTLNNNDFAIDLKGDEPTNSNSDGNDVITLLGIYANSLVDMGGGDDTFQGGVGADNVSGGDGNDTLNGGGGDDQLAGNAGDDLLTGGAGNDRFLFRSNSAFNAADFGKDIIADFAIGSDQILLSQTSFGTITSANIAFVNSDLAAETSDGLIVYSRATGKLFFNQNGAAVGLGTGVLFAQIDGAPSLTASDFQIVI
ncbi:Ig-like domain-containing protein [Microcoleus sp. ARI1-B5]|uniref:Ig-like domain-containing protein n=1 Tax=unclassified Microcoleus TaxID=2642155 RepID=UPI002FD4EA24